MFTVIFSLLAALSYGTADFFGGIASRRMSPVLVSLFSHIASFAAALAMTLFISSQWSLEGAYFGAIAGVCEAVGFLLFYYVLSIGSIAVIAPIVSVIYAIVPVAWAVAQGDELAPLAWVGVVLGFAAILALSLGESSDDGHGDPIPSRETHSKLGLRKLSLLLAIIAGTTWGFATVALDYAPEESGATPAVSGAAISFVIVILIFVIGRRYINTATTKAPVTQSLISGALFGIANALILVALATGSLALVGLLTALYPLATVLLARFVLKERITPIQWVGIIAAVVAAILMGTSH